MPVDAAEAAVPVATGPRVVPVAECIARAEAARLDVIARKSGPVAGEVVAVWTDCMYDVRRSGGYVGGLRLDGAAELSRVLTTIGQGAEAGDIVTAGRRLTGSGARRSVSGPRAPLAASSSPACSARSSANPVWSMSSSVQAPSSWRTITLDVVEHTRWVSRVVVTVKVTTGLKSP
ncbi:hypothetical protein [Streptomyces sp. NPDC048496]|uniref:hypothetical protein n=1 Tax=Streptomyces sp. NPDC048496 TaxID=3365558 RepID=UPI003718DE02